MRQRARASLLARVCACMKRESRLRRRHADQSARARRERGVRDVARTILADRKSPHANSCRPGHQHVGPAGGARRHHKAAAFLLELQMLTAYTSHMDTRVSMEHVRAGARACACSRTQSGAAHHETRSTKRSARVETDECVLDDGRSVPKRVKWLRDRRHTRTHARTPGS